LGATLLAAQAPLWPSCQDTTDKTCPGVHRLTHASALGGAERKRKSASQTWVGASGNQMPPGCGIGIILPCEPQDCPTQPPLWNGLPSGCRWKQRGLLPSLVWQHFRVGRSNPGAPQARKSQNVLAGFAPHARACLVTSERGLNNFLLTSRGRRRIIMGSREQAGDSRSRMAHTHALVLEVCHAC